MRAHRSERGIPELVNPNPDEELRLLRGDTVAAVALYFTVDGKHESDRLTEANQANVLGFYRGDIIYQGRPDLSGAVTPFERADIIRQYREDAVAVVDNKFNEEFPLAS